MKKPRLVIADDSAEMRWLVRSTLRAEYPDVVELVDGRQLFTFLLRSTLASRPEKLLLVVDVRMPVYTGLEVLGAWQDEELRTPVVVMTAYPDAAVRDEVARLDAILLPKPFTCVALRRGVAAAAAGVAS